MTTLPRLDELDNNLVQECLAELEQRIQEEHPRLDLRHGVFADLLVYYNALLTAQRRQLLAGYLKARSLQYLAEDPDAPSELVDALAANFRITRRAGSKASGEVTILVDQDTTVFVTQGSVWTAAGKRFVAPVTYTAKREVEQINDVNDRLLKPVPGGWTFTVRLVAEDIGESSNVKKDTTFLPEVRPIHFVRAYATHDFVGGRAPESNLELIGKVQQGIACKAPSNRLQWTALLRELPQFANIRHTSIVGLGDPEMLRDRHTLFPISTGGRIDWYIRSSDRVLYRSLTKDAVLVDKLPDNRGLWQISLLRDEVPALYEVRKIHPENQPLAQGSFPIVQETRSADLTGDFVPDIDANSYEWVYTRYQSVTVRFKDTETPVHALALGSVQSYVIEASGLPAIADIQDTFLQRAMRSCAADLLVKAPVPCFLQLQFTIYRKAGDQEPNLVAIKEELCRKVNNLGFVDRLYSSQLHDVIHNFLKPKQTVSAIDMFGRLRYPDGSIVYVRDSEVLRVPDEPDRLVSPRTVQFFLEEAAIGISLAVGVIEHSS